jgi:uncharacterized membrane protein
MGINRVQIGFMLIIGWVILIVAIVASAISQYPSGSIPWYVILMWIFNCVLGIFVVLTALLMMLILGLGEGGSLEEEELEQQPRKNERAPQKIQPRGKRKPKAETQEEPLLSPPPESESPKEWKEEEYE